MMDAREYLEALPEVCNTSGTQFFADEIELIMKKCFYVLGRQPTYESMAVIGKLMGGDDDKVNLNLFLDEVSVGLDTAETKITRPKVGRAVHVFFGIAKHLSADEQIRLFLEMFDLSSELALMDKVQAQKKAKEAQAKAAAARANAAKQPAKATAKPQDEAAKPAAQNEAKAAVAVSAAAATVEVSENEAPAEDIDDGNADTETNEPVAEATEKS
jgi:hypothetical protein